MGTLSRLPQLGHSLTGDHAFRETQTAFGVRGFADHGLNLLHSPLPVFGTARDVPMEFPLFQAFARLLMSLGIDDSTAGRLAGLVAFQATVVLWWAILRRWRGDLLAVTTMVMMELLPFGLQWGAACLIDFFSVALGLAMVLAFDVWLRSGRTRYLALLACAVSAWLLFLVKVTTVPAAGTLMLVSVTLAGLMRGWRPVLVRAFWGLVAGPALGLIALGLWTRHSDGIKSEYAATEFLVSSNLTDWNLGRSRLDGVRWWEFGERISSTIGGPVAAFILLGAIIGLVLGDGRARVLSLGLLASALASVLIFFTLFAVHSYYAIAIYPQLVALGGLAVVLLWEIAPRQTPTFAAAPLALVLVWLATTVTSPLGRHAVDQLLHESPIPPQATELREVTPLDAHIVTVGCDWNPEILYLAHRSGLMLRSLSRAQTDAIWRENDVSRFTYVVTCDQRISMSEYLPASTELRQTTEPDVYELGTAPAASMVSLPIRPPGR